ncbi:hypothetical protein C6341_g26852 [Phytophthora cactorum]|nr:hypothetical protein C6341_g26852 [Phytophthora cactorum]
MCLCVFGRVIVVLFQQAGGSSGKCEPGAASCLRARWRIENCLLQLGGGIRVGCRRLIFLLRRVSSSSVTWQVF